MVTNCDSDNFFSYIFPYIRFSFWTTSLIIKELDIITINQKQMREILCKASLSNIKTSLKLFKLNIEFSLPPEGVGGSKFGHNYPYIFFPYHWWGRGG